MAKFDVTRIVGEFMDAWRQKDVERAVALYAEDAELKDPTLPEPVRGRDAIRRNVEGWFGSFDFESHEVVSAAQQGNSGAVLFVGRARHTGDLGAGPHEVVPATGRGIALEVAWFMDLTDDGKVRRDRTVFDMAEMMRQLGIAPGAGQGGARATEAPARGRR